MRNLTTITKYLLVANCGIYIVAWLFSEVVANGYMQGLFNNIFGLHFFLAENFHFYQLFTYMFMHGNFTHLFFNMFGLWMFGCVVERALGQKRFIILYLLCGIGAALFQEMAQFCEFYYLASTQVKDFTFSLIGEVARNSQQELGMWTTVGASGAIYGILLSFGMLYPEERIFIFPIPIPIKAKWFIGLYVVVELLAALNKSNDGVAHLAHLGGMAIAFFLMKYWKNQAQSYYGGRRDDDFFGNLRAQWERRKKSYGQRGRDTYDNTSSRSSQQGWARVDSVNTDWQEDPNTRRDQKVVDAILDKIRRNGYDSLTAEEKRTLFDQSKKR